MLALCRQKCQDLPGLVQELGVEGERLPEMQELGSF